MRHMLLVTALASLAACSQAEPASESGPEAAAPEAQVVAADGQPTIGNYRITTSDGEVIMEELRADGTYIATIEGEVVETGTWEQKSPEQYCYTKDEDGAEQVCNTEAIDENGVWTSRDLEGNVARVERVEI